MRSCRSRVAATVSCLVMLGGLLTSAGPAYATGPLRNGYCEDGEFCYYYNSNIAGSISDFTVSVADYGDSPSTCYVFKGAGNGYGQCIKNNAASVWNRSNSTVRVYYKSGYTGVYQDISAGYEGNLNSTLYNEDASHQILGTAVQRVIAAAKSQLDQQYSWGGGNYNGPTYGICCSPGGYDDRNVKGFDCSGLMEYAFYQGARVKLPSTSVTQYNAGTKIARSSMRPGDMLFWSYNTSDPSKIHHVALYIGNGQIVEAKDHSADLQIAGYSTTGLMPYVVRAIG